MSRNGWPMPTSTAPAASRSRNDTRQSSTSTPRTGSGYPRKPCQQGGHERRGWVEGLWSPDWDWYLENEQDIVETVNTIFGLA